MNNDIMTMPQMLRMLRMMAGDEVTHTSLSATARKADISNQTLKAFIAGADSSISTVEKIAKACGREIVCKLVNL